MGTPESDTIIGVGGRGVEPARYRPSSFVRLENTVAWWSSLGLLGVLLIALGILVPQGFASGTVIAGVVLFLATAGFAGAEQYEPATVLAVAGVVWTSVGISEYLRTDPSPTRTFLVLTAVGAAALIAGAAGGIRAWDRERSTPTTESRPRATLRSPPPDGTEIR